MSSSSPLSTVLSLLTPSPTLSTSSSTQGEEEATTIITNTTTYTPLFDFPLNNSSLIGRANEGEDQDYNEGKQHDDNNTAISISSTSLLTNLTTDQTGGRNKSGSDFFVNNTTTGYMNLTFENTTERTPLLETVEEYTPVFYFLTAILLCIYVSIYFLNRYEHKKAIAEHKRGSQRWGRHITPDIAIGDVIDDEEEVSDAGTKLHVQSSQPQAPPPTAQEASELGLMSSWRIT